MVKTKAELSLNCTSEGGTEFIDFVEDSSPSVDETVMKKEVYQKLYESINGLAPKQRSVVLERFFKGKSIKEIASNQGISYMGAVKNQQNALRNLKKMLEIMV